MDHQQEGAITFQGAYLVQHEKPVEINKYSSKEPFEIKN
jgi:hypothetical protein